MRAVRKPLAPAAKAAPDQRRVISILALLASVLLLTAGTNLQGVLLPIRRQIEGASMHEIALLSSGWSLGFVAACLVVGNLVSAVGHVRSFAGLAAISGSMALLLLPLNGEWAWIGLRTVIGFCFGGLSMIIESWLNERSGAERRGGIFAAYMTVSLLASLAGSLSLTWLDPMSPLPYTLMALAVVLSIVPVSLTRSPVPHAIEPFSIRLLALYRLSPSGVVGCFAVGLVSGALGGLLPIYGLAMGFSTPRVGHLLAVALVGGALAYYPAGALSDRIDRRLVVIALGAASVAICGFLAASPDLPWRGVAVAVFAFGFVQYPLYGLCVAMTNDRVREQSFAEVASELLIIYGVGTVLGPPLAATTMRGAPRNLFLFMGLVLAALVAFTAARMALRKAASASAKRRSHPFETAPHSMQLFRPLSAVAAPNEEAKS